MARGFELLDPHPLLGAGHLVAVHRVGQRLQLSADQFPDPPAQDLQPGLSARPGRSSAASRSRAPPRLSETSRQAGSGARRRPRPARTAAYRRDALVLTLHAPGERCLDAPGAPTRSRASTARSRPANAARSSPDAHREARLHLGRHARAAAICGQLVAAVRRDVEALLQRLGRRGRPPRAGSTGPARA